MEMCCANNFQTLHAMNSSETPQLQDAALCGTMQSQIREITHSPAIWFTCQYGNVSLFLRQQEGMTVVGSKTADFIFKRQNLTSSVKCWFTVDAYVDGNWKPSSVAECLWLFSTGRISSSAGPSSPEFLALLCHPPRAPAILCHTGTGVCPGVTASGWQQQLSCAIPICHSPHRARPHLCCATAQHGGITQKHRH